MDVESSLRGSAGAVGLLLVLLVAGACARYHPPAAEPEEPSPNLIVLSVDTLGRSWLRGFDEGAAPHPTIDRLFEQSVRFTRAYSPASWTLPAHASLFTGLYPDRHGAHHPLTRIRSDAPRLAQALREAGYETIGLTDGVFLQSRYGFSAGFDVYDQEVAKGFEPRFSLPRDGAPNDPRGADLFDRAIAYLRARGEGDPPFFLFLHTFSVHDYFTIHPWAAHAVPDAERRNRSVHLSCLNGSRTCPEGDWEALRALYAAEVEHLDRGLQRLIEVLEREEHLYHTVIVLLSDHGEGLDPDRARLHHGGRLHEDQLRIPLLVRGPGMRPRTSDLPVSLVDVMPTLLELVGARTDDHLDGRSFAPTLRGGSQEDGRPLYAQEHYHWWENGQRMGSEDVLEEPLLIAVIRGPHWYIRGREVEELYDMARDPEQRNDLAVSSSELDSMRSLAEIRSRASGAPDVAPLDEELESRLRELGYIE